MIEKKKKTKIKTHSETHTLFTASTLSPTCTHLRTLLLSNQFKRLNVANGSTDYFFFKKKIPPNQWKQHNIRNTSSITVYNISNAKRCTMLCCAVLCFATLYRTVIFSISFQTTTTKKSNNNNNTKCNKRKWNNTEIEIELIWRWSRAYFTQTFSDYNYRLNVQKQKQQKNGMVCMLYFAAAAAALRNTLAFKLKEKWNKCKRNYHLL